MIIDATICHFYRPTGKCSAKFGEKCDGKNEKCSFFKTDKEFEEASKHKPSTNDNVNKLREYSLAACVIRNGLTGCYIHESMSQIKIFESRHMANEYIKEKNLNKEIYEVILYREMY